MMRRRTFLVGLTALSCAAAARGQGMLTPEEAIRQALEANRSVLIARNDARLSENNATAGNAGMLPRVDLTAGYGGSATSSKQRLSSGETIDRSAPSATNGNAGIAATWTLFDGFGMFNRSDRLALDRDRGAARVEETVLDVRVRTLAAYYGVVAEARALAVIDTGIRISEERLRIAEARREAGQTSKSEALQARADLNGDRSARLRQRAQLERARAALNLLRARPAAEAFGVADTILLLARLDSAVLRQSAIESNPELRRLRIERDIARVDRRLVDAARYPRVSLNLGYALQQSDNQAGLVASNRSAGASYGLGLTMNLFDGFNTDREAQNATIAIETGELEYADAEARILTELQVNYLTYDNSLELVTLERENMAIARENLDLALTRSAAGAIIPLEMREAQNTYVAAAGRLLRAEYEAKLAETVLLGLAGMLR